MKICHVCGGEYEDYVEMCADCGALLCDENDAGEQSEADIIIENPILAVTVEDVITAEIFCDVLKENGILYSTDEENGETAVRVLFGGSFVGVNVYVDEHDLERAREIYQEVLESEPEFEDFEEEEL